MLRGLISNAAWASMPNLIPHLLDYWLLSFSKNCKVFIFDCDLLFVHLGELRIPYLLEKCEQEIPLCPMTESRESFWNLKDWEKG
jgi:hypothetical protein